MRVAGLVSLSQPLDKGVGGTLQRTGSVLTGLSGM